MQKLLPVIVLLTSATIARADPPAPAPVVAATQAAAEPAIDPPADPFAQAIAARTVADFAQRQHDPRAMIVAARMLSEISFSGPADPDAMFTPAGLFAQARVLANGNDALLMQIRLAESKTSRGVISSVFGRGLVRSVQPLSPRESYGFTLAAKGGDTLRVGAIGDLGTKLLMRMQDASGHVVCVDDHADYAPVCQLTPHANGQYRVDIVNKSAQRSRAVILSN